MRSAEAAIAVPVPALPPGRRRAPGLAVLLIALAGFVLTLLVFWPGVMTFDARFVLAAARAGTYGDWQSPVMAWLWRLIDPLAPGPRSMLLLTTALYWSGFALIGLVLARRTPWLGPVTTALGFVPSGFMFLGILWRDILFGCVWLLAAALALAASKKEPPTPAPSPPLASRAGGGESKRFGPPPPATAAGRGQGWGEAAPAVGRRNFRIVSVKAFALRTAAVALIVLGVLLRPNAVFAAPVLITYALWPGRFALKRAVLLYIPTGVALFVVMQLVYYGALGAAREHPVQSLAVFDLGGITHFSGDVRLPGDWTAEERRRLVGDCYDPYLWDAYWYGRPCAFVMERLERRDAVFGTDVITTAWRDAVLAHPLAWLAHRAAFTTQFLLRANFTLWVFDLDDKTRLALPDNPAFAAMLAVHDRLKPTLLFRAGAWLFACVLVAAFAWRRRDTAAGAYALAVSGSAVLYVASFAVLGVAADFRYAWWAVPAALTGGAALLARRDA